MSIAWTQCCLVDGDQAPSLGAERSIQPSGVFTASVATPLTKCRHGMCFSVPDGSSLLASKGTKLPPQLRGHTTSQPDQAEGTRTPPPLSPPLVAGTVPSFQPMISAGLGDLAAPSAKGQGPSPCPHQPPPDPGPGRVNHLCASGTVTSSLPGSLGGRLRGGGVVAHIKWPTSSTSSTL